MESLDDKEGLCYGICISMCAVTLYSFSDFRVLTDVMTKFKGSEASSKQFIPSPLTAMSTFSHLLIKYSEE